MSFFLNLCLTYSYSLFLLLCSLFLSFFSSSFSAQQVAALEGTSFRPSSWKAFEDDIYAAYPVDGTIPPFSPSQGSDLEEARLSNFSFLLLPPTFVAITSSILTTVVRALEGAPWVRTSTTMQSPSSPKLLMDPVLLTSMLVSSQALVQSPFPELVSLGAVALRTFVAFNPSSDAVSFFPKMSPAAENKDTGEDSRNENERNIFGCFVRFYNIQTSPVLCVDTVKGLNGLRNIHSVKLGNLDENGTMVIPSQSFQTVPYSAPSDAHATTISSWELLLFALPDLEFQIVTTLFDLVLRMQKTKEELHALDNGKNQGGDRTSQDIMKKHHTLSRATAYIILSIEDLLALLLGSLSAKSGERNIKGNDKSENLSETEPNSQALSQFSSSAPLSGGFFSKRGYISSLLPQNAGLLGAEGIIMRQESATDSCYFLSLNPSAGLFFGDREDERGG